VLFTTKQQRRTQNNNQVDLFVEIKSKEVRGEQVKPYWIDHPDMLKGDQKSLSPNEDRFWNQLIKKYLFVLIKDPKVSVIISAVHFPTLNIPIF
jgi:hypothetical protein